MRRSLLLTIAALVAAASLVVVGVVKAAPAKVRGTLNGVVGPGFTITLMKGGNKVQSIKKGQWRLVIKDMASVHNFHLTGPGVNKRTGVAATGTRTWLLTLVRGTYRFVCDPHATTMKGSFRVRA